MPELSGLPYVEAEFDRDGKLSPAEQERAVLDGLKAARATDLVVIAHGWNNDMEEARGLYAALFGQVGTVLGETPPPSGRRGSRNGDPRAAVAVRILPDQDVVGRRRLGRE
jgi:hypothetical protein